MAEVPPNFLVLMSDDQQPDAIGALGNAQVHTPHLDGLVRGGFSLRNAYCMGSTMPAVCVPSRAMFLTARSLFRVPPEIPPEIDSWPQALRRAGYQTYAVGKWHNGPASLSRMFENGSALFFGGMHDQIGMPVQSYDPEGRFPASRARKGAKFSSELFADAAIEFLKSRDPGRPFLLYVAFTSPHDPRTPPEPFASRYRPWEIELPKNFLPLHPFDNGEMVVRDELLAPFPRTAEIVRRHIADYYGMISHLDAQVGRILAALDESGARANTVILFLSDHGLALGRHGLLGKQNLYEHSARAPVVFSGPGIPKGTSSDALAYLFDLGPTLCDLAGVPAPDGAEGMSLAPLLEGETQRARPYIFGAYRDVQRMVRGPRWKLLRYPKIHRTQLFDLASDPEELRDLSNDPARAETLREMLALLRRAQADFGDALPLEAPVASPESVDAAELNRLAKESLPAREGRAAKPPQSGAPAKAGP